MHLEEPAGGKFRRRMKCHQYGIYQEMVIIYFSLYVAAVPGEISF